MTAAAALAACLAALSALPGEAGAALPGQNGKIAYAVTDGRSPGGYSAIFTANPDGSDRSTVVEGNGETIDTFIDPSFSPDGRRIAYAGDDGDWEIYTIGARGGAAFKVTNNGKDDRQPSYSPDGRRIAYTIYGGQLTSDEQDAEVHTIGVGGGGESRVTDDVRYRAEFPSWGRRP